MDCGQRCHSVEYSAWPSALKPWARKYSSLSVLVSGESILNAKQCKFLWSSSTILLHCKNPQTHDQAFGEHLNFLGTFMTKPYAILLHYLVCLKSRSFVLQKEQKQTILGKFIKDNNFFFIFFLHTIKKHFLKKLFCIFSSSFKHMLFEEHFWSPYLYNFSNSDFLTRA